MSNRNLLILAIVAVVMVLLAAALQGRKNRPAERDYQPGSHLIQGLDTVEIASIVIGAGEDPIRLIREGMGFVVENKGGYPAVVSKINDLLRSCVRIKIIEKITGDASNHEQLEVTEEKARSVVKLLDKEGQIITGVVVGKTDSQTKATYVRVVTEDDVYSIKDPPSVRASAIDYIEKEIVNADRYDVVRVTVIGPEGTYTLKVDDSNEDNITIEDMPEGKKLKISECKEVLSALSYLSCDDVKKEPEQDAGLVFDRLYVSELKNSTTKENEAKFLARDNALAFAKRHKGWLYRIPKWKAKNLTRGAAELYEDEKVDEPVSADEAEEVTDGGAE
jgi:hypothetical protein